MINESDCLRDFSKRMTKKYRDTHKKIRNCNEFDNSLNFAKVSQHVDQFALSRLWHSWLFLSKHLFYCGCHNYCNPSCQRQIEMSTLPCSFLATKLRTAHHGQAYP